MILLLLAVFYPEITLHYTRNDFNYCCLANSPEACFFGDFLVARHKKVTCRAGAEARYKNL
jgi:hypothetical protein